MQRIENVDYKNIKMENRNYAGLEGFDFTHNGSVIATTYVDDLRVAMAIDNALKAQFDRGEDEAD